MSDYNGADWVAGMVTGHFMAHAPAITPQTLVRNQTASRFLSTLPAEALRAVVDDKWDRLPSAFGTSTGYLGGEG